MPLFIWKDPKLDHVRPRIFITSLLHAPQIESSLSHEVRRHHPLANKGWLGLFSRRSVLDLGLTLALTSSTPPLLFKLLNKRLVVHGTTPSSCLVANDVSDLRMDAKSSSGRQRRLWDDRVRKRGHDSECGYVPREWHISTITDVYYFLRDGYRCAAEIKH